LVLVEQSSGGGGRGGGGQPRPWARFVPGRLITTLDSQLLAAQTRILTERFRVSACAQDKPVASQVSRLSKLMRPPKASRPQVISFEQPAPAQGYHSAQGVKDPKRPSSLIMSARPGMVAVAWILTPQLPAEGSQPELVISTDEP